MIYGLGGEKSRRDAGWPGGKINKVATGGFTRRGTLSRDGKEVGKEGVVHRQRYSQRKGVGVRYVGRRAAVRPEGSEGLRRVAKRTP